MNILQRVYLECVAAFDSLQLYCSVNSNKSDEQRSDATAFEMALM